MIFGIFFSKINAVHNRGQWALGYFFYWWKDSMHSGQTGSLLFLQANLVSPGNVRHHQFVIPLLL
jgi:hypothetical protein